MPGIFSKGRDLIKVFVRRIKNFTCFIIVSISLCAFVPIRVLAGDINAAEQSVISYCSGTFSYDGKTYQATAGAKAELYAKLSADGVDLTANEARVAKNEFSKSVAEGVAQGYLVEVGGSTDKKQDSENSRQNAEDQENSQEAVSEPEGSKADGDKDKDVVEEENETEDSFMEEKNSTGSEESKAADEVSDSTHSEEDTKKVTIQEILNDINESQEDGYTVTVSEDGQSRVLSKSEIEKADKKELAGYELYTIEAHGKGTVLICGSDGTVLFDGSLPIKNTGIYTGWTDRATGLFFLLLLIAAVIPGLFVWYRNRKGRKAVPIEKEDLQSESE